MVRNTQNNWASKCKFKLATAVRPVFICLMHENGPLLADAEISEWNT